MAVKYQSKGKGDLLYEGALLGYEQYLIPPKAIIWKKWIPGF